LCHHPRLQGRAPESNALNFKACDECAEEAAREDAREAAELRKAQALRLTLKPCVNCKTRLSPCESMYCSDSCKRDFLGSFRLEQTAPRFAAIGNGLYVRTASKRRKG
jgi:hypothetical protein